MLALFGSKPVQSQRSLRPRPDQMLGGGRVSVEAWLANVGGWPRHSVRHACACCCCFAGTHPQAAGLGRAGAASALPCTPHAVARGAVDARGCVHTFAHLAERRARVSNDILIASLDDQRHCEFGIDLHSKAEAVQGARGRGSNRRAARNGPACVREELGARWGRRQAAATKTPLPLPPLGGLPALRPFANAQRANAPACEAATVPPGPQACSCSG